MPLKKEDIVFDKRATGYWCKLPYSGHPKGCVNFNKRVGCPPNSKFFGDLISAPFFLVAQEFDLSEQVEILNKKESNLEDKRAFCLDYYRGSFSKKIKEEAEAFLESRNQDLFLLERPEANGVDIFNTCKNVGILLERDPKRKFWKVILIGKKVNPDSIDNNK